MRNIIKRAVLALIISMLCGSYIGNAEQIEVVPVQVQSPSESIDETLENLKDPDETLNSIYRALMLIFYLQDSPYREVSYAPTVKEVADLADMVKIEYLQHEGVSIELDNENENTAIVFLTREWEMSGGVAIKLYTSGVSMQVNEITDEAIQKACKNDEEETYIDKIEIILLDEYGAYAAITVCDFGKEDVEEIS